MKKISLILFIMLIKYNIAHASMEDLSLNNTENNIITKKEFINAPVIPLIPQKTTTQKAILGATIVGNIISGLTGALIIWGTIHSLKKQPLREVYIPGIMGLTTILAAINNTVNTAVKYKGITTNRYQKIWFTKDAIITISSLVGTILMGTRLCSSFGSKDSEQKIFSAIFISTTILAFIQSLYHTVQTGKSLKKHTAIK